MNLSLFNAAAHYLPQTPTVLLNLCLERAHKARLIDVLTLLLQVHSLIFERALHPELELLATHVEETIEELALHLKEFQEITLDVTHIVLLGIES